ncbi:transcription factor DYT1, partial [Momordica charantia]|uniref:Transcription factor DYT1 n=1 Tax=Momordica charantia TaxID=3673 RepID=A0A6J1CZR8_MOMCH
MAFVGFQPDELRMIEEESGSSSIKGQRRSTDESAKYKSKNLHAERRRRQKLSDRLLLLRATMNKATIIEDAITYIQQLQQKVDILKDQLVELEASSEKNIWPTPRDIEAPINIKRSYIQADVRVTQIDEQKLWVKILFEKQKGAFTKLIQGLDSFGFELIDISVTTVKGAVLVTTIIN